jgi:hypothetical protein
MVKGLDVFIKYFKEFSQNYVIIGGTACDLIIDEAGFYPRATKDIDLILVVEALTSDFVKQFWQFVKDGRYERNESSDTERKYYRFVKPEQEEFPFQIELFSRSPDLIHIDEGIHLTPIPTPDDLSSLSAILLDEEYYGFILEHSSEVNALHRANIESLICLKAKAYLEITERIKKGSKEDSKLLRKHKGDIFRLGAMLPEGDQCELPGSIKNDMTNFIKDITEELPGKELFRNMGIGRVSPKSVLDQLIKVFSLEI